MATEQNNIHINSFTKGMNTDTSYDMIGNEQYVFGKNIRITANALLQGVIDSNCKEGIVTPVPDGQDGHGEAGMGEYKEVLAVASIGNIGAIIVNKETNWEIYRIDCSNDVLTFTKIFTSDKPTTKHRFSVILNKELEDCIKLYIADGEDEILTINIHSSKDEYNLSLSSVDDLINNMYYPVEQIMINQKISGTLKTGQVQYTYRFYNKYGISSKLAPLTSKIQVIDSSRAKENGNAEDTQTSVGFQLLIPTDDIARSLFNHIQVYRLEYVKPNTDSNIYLIYDAEMNAIDNIKLNDTGLDPIQELSIDEFSALNSMDIVPQCLEQNQGYLFAANINDKTMYRVPNSEFDPKAYQFNYYNKILLYEDSDTIYQNNPKSYNNVSEVEDGYDLNIYVDMTKEPSEFNMTSKCCQDKDGYLGGSGKNVSWRFITTHIQLDYASERLIPDYGKNSKCDIYYIKQRSNGELYEVKSSYDTDDVFSDHNICSPETLSYNDIFTSSSFRSLKRDEVYRYGIVLYDNYGRRSDVQWIADIRTPAQYEFSHVICSNDVYYAVPIGIQFDVKVPDGVSSYQIVRCAKTASYSRNLMQCAVTRPVKQILYSSSSTTRKYSPYYPTALLMASPQVVSSNQDWKKFVLTDDGIDFTTYSTDDYIFYKEGGLSSDATTDILGGTVSSSHSTSGNGYYDIRMFQAFGRDTDELVQLFSPEIQIQQEDAISKLTSFIAKLQIVQRAFGETVNQIDDVISTGLSYWYKDDDKELTMKHYIDKSFTMLSYNAKYLPYFVRSNTSGANTVVNKKTKYGNEQTASEYSSEADVNSNDKSTSSYLFKYFGITNGTDGHDSEIVDIKNVNNPTWEQGFSNIQLSGSSVISGVKQYKSFTTTVNTYEYVNWVCNGMYDLKLSSSLSAPLSDDKELCAILEGSTQREHEARGWFGPGPRCFIAKLNLQDDSYLKNVKQLFKNTGTSWADDSNLYPYIIIANITHTPVQYSGLTEEEKQYDVYYGFGDYCSDTSKPLNVFNGDTYIVPCEITSIYKSYDFNSFDTIPSTQIIYYIPLETPINTYFDYGMDYKNTQCKSVQLEPGEITGVTSQDRPEHQYNSVYSDNNISNDIFNVQTLEDSQQEYTQRIHYSELKTNGEMIDNWNNFKALDYIDADTRYGQITNLLTNKDILYFWQEQAFGKLSVNERSLVTDNNSNTIQLGQGGVLQRTDYINTRYGMRAGDYSAIAAEGSIYWIDIVNRAIAMSNGQSVINMGEQLNVQSYINQNIDESIPEIHYDLQNNELICKCLKGDQMVFNLKLNVATSVFNRKYEDIAMFNNVLYGIYQNNILKYNYLAGKDRYYDNGCAISFIINPSSSITKVFDDQEVTTLNRGVNPADYLDGKSYSFETNIIDLFTKNPDGYTDREGNIRYTLPRYGENNYGNRLRGKWLKVDIEDSKPKYECSISHVLTKFRQSFS